MDSKLPPEYRKSFKDADIRGVMVKELDDDVAYQVARAFVSLGKYKEVVVGYDMRVSTPSLAEAFMRGVQDAGADVLNIGLVHSPMLYFTSGTYSLPGVMITASHSPANYNGLKLVEPGAVPLTTKSGLGDILKYLEAGKFKKTKRRGKRQDKNVNREYQTYVLKGVKKSSFKGMKIAADIGNGMGSVVMPLLSEKLPVTFTTLFSDMDGRFPNRGSDPTLSKHQTAIKNKLKSGTFDFGIAFDGDADRIAFLDEKGQYVNCAVIGSLIAEKLLIKNPGSPIVFTNLTSRVYEESIKKAGGKPVRARVGHAFLKRKMRDKGAIFGCEHSGHFFFEDFFTTDSVVLTLVYVMEVYAKAKASGQTFSQMVAPYRVYQQLEDTMIEVKNKQACLKKMELYLKKTLPNAKFKKFDGLYVTTDKAWGAVKPSVTEHAIKVMFESKKKAEATKLQTHIVKYLKQIAKD